MRGPALDKNGPKNGPEESSVEAVSSGTRVMGQREYWLVCTPESGVLRDVISVNRYLRNSTVVGTVTTFGIGGRTDVDGSAGSSFAMMISHGQKCSSTGGLRCRLIKYTKMTIVRIGMR